MMMSTMAEAEAQLNTAAAESEELAKAAALVDTQNVVSDTEDDDDNGTTAKTAAATTSSNKRKSSETSQRASKMAKTAEMAVDENFCICLRYLLTKMWCISVPPLRSAAKNLKSQLTNELNLLLVQNNGGGGTGVSRLPVMRVFQRFLDWLSKHTNELTMCGLSASLHWSGGWTKSAANNACAIAERFDTGDTLLKGYNLNSQSDRADFQNLQKIGLCPFAAIEPILKRRSAQQTPKSIVVDLETVLAEKSLYTDFLNPLDLIFKFFVIFAVKSLDLDCEETKRLIANLWADEKKNEHYGYFEWDNYDFDKWPEYSLKNHLVTLAKHFPQTMCVFAQPKIICDILADYAPAKPPATAATATTPKRTSASYSTRRTSARIQTGFGAIQTANNLSGRQQQQQQQSFIVDDKFPPSDVDFSANQLKRITSAIVDLLYSNKPTCVNIDAQAKQQQQQQQQQQQNR